MVEAGPENKLGGKTFALDFSLQTFISPAGSVREGDQTIATENAAAAVGR